jgi:hypothetical protein
MAVVLGRACRPLPELPERPGHDGGIEARATVVLEPAAELDAAPAVVRIHITAAPALDAAELWLFRGELSSYHVGRIGRRELSMTLLERVVAAQVWKESGTIVLAPSLPLVPGELYSLAGPELGLIAVLRAGAHQRPFFERVWPPLGEAGGAGYIVLCAEDAAAPVELAELTLDPLGVRAQLRPGVADDAGALPSCVHVRAESEPPDGSALVLPPTVAGMDLDPAPLRQLPAAPAPPPSCGADERPFGPGCILVLDDRLVVRSGEASALWVIRTVHSTSIASLPARGRLVANGLEPATSEWIWATIIDANGSVTHVSERVITSAPRPHLVVNEVLADPVGPEPAQEWIELFNDGVSDVELAGWSIEDLGGRTELPPATIPPRGYALVVPASFSEHSSWDVEPSSAATLVRVPALGKDGLSNLGESISLRAPDGSVVSRVPPLPRPKAGRSVARREPRTLDDAADGFALHADPGASPGAVNTF